MPYIDTKYIGDCNYCRHHRTGSCDTWCDCGECFEPDMTKIPLADVVEVRQGHWEWFEEWIPSTPDNVRECEDCGWRCSECKTALADAVGGYWDDVSETPKLHYCPICGAIMGGKRKDGAE